MLTITKIFNNNALQANNALGNEVVVLGKGIAFGKKIGDFADESLVEKTFSLTKSPFASRLLALLGEIPSEYFRLTDQIVRHAQSALGSSLSPSIYVGLTDHMFHAVQRHQQGIASEMGRGLSLNIQRLYPQEFAVAKFAIDVLNQTFKVQLTENERSFIALHLFHARTDSDNLADTYRSAQIIKDVLQIIHHHLQQTFDENSLDYARFLTHLQYFSLRLREPSSASQPASEDFLHTQTRLAYPKAHQCVEKIARYLEQQYHKTLSADEALYLTLHIQRLLK